MKITHPELSASPDTQALSRIRLRTTAGVIIAILGSSIAATDTARADNKPQWIKDAAAIEEAEKQKAAAEKASAEVAREKTVEELCWAGLPLPEMYKFEKKGHVNHFDSGRYCPAWTYYIAKKEPKGKADKLAIEFKADPDNSEGWQIHPEDYKDSGFVMAQMAPDWAVNLSFGEEAAKQTYFTTNVAPMKKELRDGLWNSLAEKVVKEYAPMFGDILVFVGPIFPDAEKAKKFGKTRKFPYSDMTQETPIHAPIGFYMVLVRDPEKPQTLALAFPQDTTVTSADEAGQFLISIQELEKLTNVGFLKNFTDQQREKFKYVKTDKAEKMW